jgi:WhiB family redox-sensing transcriptional regulator
MIQTKSGPTLRQITDRSWMEQATCRGADTELWFNATPPKHVRRHIQQVCSSCPMTRLCLSFGLVNGEEFGAWGGLTMSELRPLQRRLHAGETLSSVLSPGSHKARLGQGSEAA